MFELALAAAGVAGLAGGVHCAGMCGGIVGALCNSSGRQDAAPPLRYLLTYKVSQPAAIAGDGLLCHIVPGLGGLLP